jgi:hypothetical protein
VDGEGAGEAPPAQEVLLEGEHLADGLRVALDVRLADPRGAEHDLPLVGQTLHDGRKGGAD